MDWYAQKTEAELSALFTGAWYANDSAQAARVKLEKIRRGLLTLGEANKTWPEIKAEWLWK